MEDSAFEIDISNRQSALDFNENSLEAAVLKALAIENVASAVLSISIVDNPAIHAFNRDHLQHDYPTDVISFQLDFISADERQSDDLGDEEEDPEQEVEPEE